MLLWQDVNDPDMIMIGDKANWASKEQGKMERYSAWASMHIDGISDLFGGDATEAVRRLKTQPAGTAVDVQLVVLRVDGEDVSGCETAAHQAAASRNTTGNPDSINVCQWMEDIGI